MSVSTFLGSHDKGASKNTKNDQKMAKNDPKIGHFWTLFWTFLVILDGHSARGSKKGEK